MDQPTAEREDLAWVYRRHSTRVDDGSKGWSPLAIKGRGTNCIREEGVEPAVTPDLSE